MKIKFIIILCTAIFFSGCDLFDDSPCGARQTFDLYLLGKENLANSAMGSFNTYVENGNRVFQWSELVEDICTDEHVKIEGRVALLDETTTGINARAGAGWLFLFEEIFTLNKSGTDLKGSGEVGLMQGFNKEAAWCVPRIEVFFPTKGSLDADKNFFLENVISIELNAKYRKH